MPIGSVLLILGFLILVIAVVTRPLWSPQTEPWTEGEEPSVLLAERERIIEALLELDFDHQLGKVPEEIFTSQRSFLVKKGAQVLEQLDAQEIKTDRTSLGAKDDLERLIAARKSEKK